MAPRQQIFIIDDDASFRKATAALLNALGFKTQLHASAESFLSSGWQDSDACCALIDVQLQGMSGFELARCLKDAGSSVPIIFITGNDCKSARRSAEDKGAGYLAKPFAAKALREAIRQALD
jgi:two-component system, LuxR family, response regulator FixJ